MRIRVGAMLALTLMTVGAPTWSAPPNKAPTVSLTTPTNGATFVAPATISIGANALDSDGTIIRVDFYQGTTLLGSRTAAPYAITWSGVAAGAYSLTAQAFDNSGGFKTSTAVSVTVTGAKVIIATPASGSMVYGGAVTVSGSFTGPTDSTVLVDNGNSTRLASLDGNAYTATIPIYVGANTLRVVVARRDKTSDSASVIVTGNANPLLTFTAPATTVFNAPASVNLVVDAASPAGTVSKVDFFRNGTLLGTATTPPYQFLWSNVVAGSYSVTATATDANGYTGSAYLPITVNGPNASPTVAMTAPANGASFTAPANITLTATASDSDGSITMVEFVQNGSVLGVSNIAPYGMIWSNVAPGSYTLSARATDNRSAVTTSAPVTITVGAPNNPPTVSLTSPATGSTFSAPATISLAANASDSDGSITRVDFYRGGTLIASSSSAPYVANWSNVGAGSYTLTAKATDNRGAVTTSSPVSVAVTANSAPSVILTSPSMGASYFAPATIALAAAATDSDGTVARIDFYQGTTLIGTAASAPYTYTWSNVAQGNYNLTARATDDRGAAATSAAVNVTVSGANFAIVSPANNATVDTDFINVTGTTQAPANSGVTVNGIVAAMDSSGNFYANGVQLTTGANTIAATLTTLDGQVTTQSAVVTSTGPAPIKITASPTDGLGPLSVAFDITPRSGVVIQKVEFDVDGNGTVEQTLIAEPWTTTATYSGSGKINTVVRVTDTSGAIYTQTIPIVLTNQALLDQTLRAVWNGMKTALTAGDKTRAMQYLDASAQQRYGPVFDILLPNMSQIAASFSDLQSVALSGGIGEYAINRTINGENRIFFIYFGRNGDGVWRLGSM
ncbi:MAG TPA: Ig-like domain-containing protein [Casimicrobiaceae bacterium]|nr:Ig-like domain-containing protein [Casimicrobiaceae bacterium]